MDQREATGRNRGSMRVVRSRGAVTGLLLGLFGLWGAIVPFIGPYFGFSYTPATVWAWTWGRFWLEVLPGIATMVGGFLLLTTANRAVGVFGGYLASAAGAWFIVGPLLGRLWGGPEGATGVPTGGLTVQVLEQLFFFYGLGALILFLAAQGLGRFTVRSVRDVRAAERHAEQRHEEALRDEGRRDVVDQPDVAFRDNTAARENTVAPVEQPVGHTDVETPVGHTDVDTGASASTRRSGRSPR